MRQVIANMIIIRTMEFPPYMTTEEIKEKILEKLKATFDDGETSISVGIIELPADAQPKPTGE